MDPAQNLLATAYVIIDHALQPNDQVFIELRNLGSGSVHPQARSSRASGGILLCGALSHVPIRRAVAAGCLELARLNGIQCEILVRNI
ncbi:hypothetical protein BDR04DRAFT_1102061 [Suillus decipiens]|nr:hypothetical protein BDR04DRAFT_1102061 [Suillus decipiens]